MPSNLSRAAAGSSRSRCLDLDANGRGTALVPKSESEYFLELINGAAAAATDAKYALIVVSPGMDASSMRSFGVDGMIIVDPKGSGTVPAVVLFADQYPVVTTGEPVVAAGRPCFVVDNDHEAAAREIFDHFAAQGRSQPAIITDTTSRSYIRDIQHAYGEWCNANNVRPASVAVAEASPTEMGKALASLRNGPSPADAIYTSSDECAIALLDAAREAGGAGAGRAGVGQRRRQLDPTSHQSSGDRSLPAPQGHRGAGSGKPDRSDRTKGPRLPTATVGQHTNPDPDACGGARVHSHGSESMKVLVISASPREDGNSHLLAESACAGAESVGHEVEHVFLDQYVDRMLDNCRSCRTAAGFCSLADRYESLLLDKMLPADGIIYAMPLYFYGMPARLKTVFDRLFCYTANSAPQQEQVVGGITDKTVGVLISCEESYVGATAGVIAQFQELTSVSRPEPGRSGGGQCQQPRRDRMRPDRSPVPRADLGARLFDIRVTDYRLTTVRSNKVWDPVGC